MILDTPEQIAYFRYASLKYQLRLELSGLKSSGGALRPRLAKEFGLSPRAGHCRYIAHCAAKMQELMPCA